MLIYPVGRAASPLPCLFLLSPKLILTLCEGGPPSKCVTQLRPSCQKPYASICQRHPRSTVSPATFHQPFVISVQIGHCFKGCPSNRPSKMLCWLLGLAAAAVLYALLDFWYRRPLLENIADKRVFITGTDTGFGRELALRLDAQGLRVYAGCYTEGGAEDLRRVASSRMLVFNIDVSKVDSIRRARDVVEEDVPPGEGLWGVVNNAGIHRSMLFGLTTWDDFREVFDVNFFGTVNVNEIFGPLVKRAQGRIVNIISVLGRSTGAAEPYLSSKAALIPYTDGLRRWMKLFDVHVAAIEPGYFRTDITKSSFLVGDFIRTWERLPAHLKEEYGEEFTHNYKKEIQFHAKHFPLSGFNKIPNVLDAITHALLAKHPKSRYTIGWDAILVFKGIMFMPDWIIDLVFSSCFPSLKKIRKRVIQQRALVKSSTNEPKTCKNEIK